MKNKYVLDGVVFTSIDNVAEYLKVDKSNVYYYYKKLGSIEKAAHFCNILDLNYTNNEGILFRDARSLCNYYNLDYKIFIDKYDSGLTIDEIFKNRFVIKDMLNYTGCKSIREYAVKHKFTESQYSCLYNRLRRANKFIPDLLEIGIPMRSIKQFVFGNIVFSSYYEFCNHYKINYNKFIVLISLGSSIEEAFSMINRNAVFYKGEVYKSKKEMCSVLGIKYQTLLNRLKRGLSLEEAVDK